MTAQLGAPQAPAAQPLPLPPLVSVLVRSTGRPFLAQALASVAAQTHARIELVVVAARPDHPPVPAMVGLHPLRLIPTERPLRRSEAANRALQAAQGSHLLFLDDDDWLMPDHVAGLVRLLQGQNQARVAYTGVALVDAQGQPLGQVFDLPFDAVRQLAGNLTPIHAVLFSADLVAQGCRFDESLDLYEDWDFWLQLARRSVFVHRPGVSAVYRIHDSSGVHAEAGVPGEATLRVYEKWRNRWTAQQLAGVMQRVWSHADLEARLQQLEQQAEQRARQTTQRQAEADAQSVRHLQLLQDQQRLIAEQADQLQQAGLRSGQLAQQVQQLSLQLEDQRRRTAEVEHLLARQMARAQRLAAECQALRDSTSWRLTAPLRAVADWRAARRHSAPGAVAPMGPPAVRPAAQVQAVPVVALPVQPASIGAHGPAANDTPEPLDTPGTGNLPVEAFAPLHFYLLPPHARQRVTLVIDSLANPGDAERWGPALCFVAELANRRDAHLRIVGRLDLPDGGVLDRLLLHHGLVLARDCQLAHARWDDASQELDRLHGECVITTSARNLASVLSGLEAAVVMHWLSEADHGLDAALQILHRRREVQVVVAGHDLLERLGPRLPAELGLRVSVGPQAPATLGAQTQPAQACAA